MNPIGSFSPSLPLAAMRTEFPLRPQTQGLGGNSPEALAPGVQGAGAANPFDNVLGRFVNEVNDKQAASANAVSGVLSGQNVPLHQAMLAMEEASVSFQLMVEVRNKLLEGYQELLRMQV